jgi:chemotaxis protein MotB
MNRVAAVALGALIVSCLSAVGCCDKQEKELKTLQQQYNDLQMNYNDSKKALDESKAKNNDLMAQLESKDMELSAAKRAGGGATKVETKIVKEVVSEHLLPVPTGWHRTAGGVAIAVGSDILFPSGKAELTAGGEKKIREIAATLKTSFTGQQVRVYGYTDADPIRKTKDLWQDNLDLSASRAMSVTRELTKMGISPDRVETVAMGATHPEAAGNTADAKAKNRRVEIEVVKH